MVEISPDQLNVLVVDDEPLSLGFMVEAVTRQGCQAVPAESAEEILKLLPFWTIHVAFIDHHLPGMEGMLLGEYLRRNNPDMIIAIVTGAPEPWMAKKSDELGLEFIAKPFGISVIAGVIEKYKHGAAFREQTRRQQIDEDYVPPFGRFVESLEETFEIPGVPARIESRITETVKRSLNNLRSATRYNERDRVIALTGLLSARVLGVKLPKTQTDRTLYEEYDALMSERGRRREFT
jgi:response regulator RpfG family c-di-GMP phosphodiesterase